MITYNELKRKKNITKHCIDLAECESIFDAPMLTDEDVRDAYGEQRFKSLGWLGTRVVALIWVDHPDGPHLISCRYADKHETQHYFKAFL